MYSNEIAMYPDIIKNIEYIMKFSNYDYKIYKTWKEFDPDLKDRFPDVLDILGKIVLPDIIVSYNIDGKRKWLIVEVKINSLTVKDIAQAKMYGDIFDADKVVLVSLADLRRKIKNYYEFNKCLLEYSKNRILSTVVLKDGNLLFDKSFPSGEVIF